MHKHNPFNILLILCIIISVFSVTSFADELSFSDINGHWASEIIYKWAGLGAVSGDGGAFRPDDPITRAEIAVIIDNLMDYTEKSANLFVDIEKTAWYTDAFLRVNAAGIIYGYENGHAYPWEHITYNQAKVMTAKAFNIDAGLLNDINVNESINTEFITRAETLALIDKASSIRDAELPDITETPSGINTTQSGIETEDGSLPVTDAAIDTEPAKKIPILLYHHILPAEDLNKYGWSGNNSVISLENFHEQMMFLHNNNFRTATLGELEQFLSNGKELPKKTVVITFDDGYLSNAVYAYPVLKEYGFSGTIFMVGITASVEQKIFSPDRLQHISAFKLDDYRDVFEFGCHTYDMHRKIDNRAVLVNSNRDEVTQDLLKNKELICSRYFSYPYGIYNEEAIRILKDNGYKLAFTVNRGYVTAKSNKYKLQRFSISPSLTMKEFEKIVTIE